MPSINTKITTSNAGIATHEDIFGIGGYVVISSGWDTQLTSTRINQIVPVSRRKVGMLVWDEDTRKHYRCSATGTINSTTDGGTWSVAETLDTSTTITGGTY